MENQALNKGRSRVHWNKDAPNILYRSEIEHITRAILEKLDRGEVYITVEAKPRGNNGLQIVEDFIESGNITPEEVKELYAAAPLGAAGDPAPY